MKNEIVKAPFLRRIGATITDIFLVVVLFLIFNSYVFQPMFTKAFDIESKTETYRQIMIDSHLYVSLENGGVDEVIDTYDATTSKITEFEFYQTVDKCIQEFYLKYEQEGINIESYNKAKIDSTLFELVNNEYVIKENISKNQYKEFITTQFAEAENLLSHYDQTYIKLANDLFLFDLFNVSLSLTISFLLVYLLPSLLFANGETVGKKLLALGMVNAKNGFVIKKSQVIVRFVIFYFLEIVLSVFTLGLPLLVSFSMMIFNKNGLALHDYLSATICVDKKGTVIFKNYEEYLSHKQIELNK